MKLEINSRRKTKKFTIVWKLNNTMLSHQRLKEEITRNIENETSENENTTYQKLWDAAKVLVKEKIIAIRSYPVDLKSVTQLSILRN